MTTENKTPARRGRKPMSPEEKAAKAALRAAAKEAASAVVDGSITPDPAPAPEAKEKKPRKPRTKKEKAPEVETPIPEEAPAEGASSNDGGEIKAPKKKSSRGGWSSEKGGVTTPLTYLHVEVEWTKSALGTSPNNKEIYSDYIASRSPDAMTIQEEIAAIGGDEVAKKQLLVYPKGSFIFDPEKCRYWDALSQEIPEEVEANGMAISNHPFYYDYQIRGAFKDSCGLLSRGGASVGPDGKKVGSNLSSQLKAYKKVIDGGIFVFPRRIGVNIPDTYLDDDNVTEMNSFDSEGNLRVIERPIRISDSNGERTAIASSEMIPVGSSMKFTIGVTSPKYIPVVMEWLDYFSIHGVSGWRNSGLGTLRWREIQEDMTPYED